MDVVADHCCPNQGRANKEEGEKGSSPYLLSLTCQKSKLRPRERSNLPKIAQEMRDIPETIPQGF